MSSTATISILLLHGDAESRLLTEAEVAVQSVFADRPVQLVKQWMPRADWLELSDAGDSALHNAGVLDGSTACELLRQPHRLVVFSLLPSVVVPGYRHRSGATFLAHEQLRAGWSDAAIALVANECDEVPPMSPLAAAQALEPVIERLHERGVAVAVTTTFRHVRQPLIHRGVAKQADLRELVRRVNLEVIRLSQRTGCFVLDFDRTLAQEGGASLDADYSGGGERAGELALDEFAAVLMDAMPDEFMPMEVL